jgi:hypothetical protein
MLALNRPVAIVLDERSDDDLLRWLTRQGRGGPVYQDDERVLWLEAADNDALAAGLLPAPTR